MGRIERTRVSVERQVPVAKVFAMGFPTLTSSESGFATDCPIVLTAPVSPVTAAFIAVFDDC